MIRWAIGVTAILLAIVLCAMVLSLYASAREDTARHRRPPNLLLLFLVLGMFEIAVGAVILATGPDYSIAAGPILFGVMMIIGGVFYRRIQRKLYG